MIARCQHIHPGIKQGFANFRRHAKAAGRVFTIHHEKVQLVFIAQGWHLFDHLVTGRTANNITQKQHTDHRRLLAMGLTPKIQNCGRCRPDGVNTASNGMS